jgi:hypothetical protein
MSDKYFKFWYELHLALQKMEIPMARRTDKSADVGWGKGMRILIDDQDRITHPEGRFVPLEDVLEVQKFAEAIRKGFRLTKTQREVLNMLRVQPISVRTR